MVPERQTPVPKEVVFAVDLPEPTFEIDVPTEVETNVVPKEHVAKRHALRNHIPEQTIHHPCGSRCYKQLTKEERLKTVSEKIEKPYIDHIRRQIVEEIESRLIRAYANVHRKVVKWIVSTGPCKLEDAEDILCGVWLELLIGVRCRQIRYWSDAIVYKVAWHRFLNYANAERRRERLNRQLAVADVLSIDVDRGILINGLLTLLSEEERAVIERLYLEGWTLEETANVLGISLSTVKRLQAGAMEWMRTKAGRL